MHKTRPRARHVRLARAGVSLFVLVAAAAIGVAPVAAASPTPPGVMTSAVDKVIRVGVVKGNPRGGAPDANCAPIVQEVRFDNQPTFRWAPPTANEAGGVVPPGRISVPHDGIYTVGAVCRDPSGVTYSPESAMFVGAPPASGPAVTTVPWSKPFPWPFGADRTIAVTVNTGNEPCGVNVTQVTYGDKPYRFVSSAPDDFVAPHTTKTVTVLPPGPGLFMAIATCGGYSTWPPVFTTLTS